MRKKKDKMDKDSMQGKNNTIKSGESRIWRERTRKT